MDHQSVNGDEAYLLPSEVAEELGGVSSKTIGRWAKQGKLPNSRELHPMSDCRLSRRCSAGV
jgi:hypothetical protein